MNQHASINRRDFLGPRPASLWRSPSCPSRSAAWTRRARSFALADMPWLTITPDGTITIVSPAAEMGRAPSPPSRPSSPTSSTRLVEGQAGLPPAWRGKEIRQSGIRHELPDLSQRLCSAISPPARIAGAQARRVLLMPCGEMERSGGLSLRPSERGDGAVGRDVSQAFGESEASAPASSSRRTARQDGERQSDAGRGPEEGRAG